MAKPSSSVTQEQRRIVKALAGYGLPQAQICSIVHVASPKLLRKHFGEELKMGAIEAKAQVLKTAFQMAASGKNPSATMFWLKTRSRWSEAKGLPVEEAEFQEWIFNVIETRPKPNHFGDLKLLLTEKSRPDWGGDQPQDEEEPWLL